MQNKWLASLFILNTLSTAAGFEHAMALIPKHEAAAYRFDVPAIVYQHVHHADLRDVRVINVQGDEVPMRITLREDQIHNTWSEVTLPIFQLHAVENIPISTKQTKTTWQGDQQSLTVTTSEQVVTYLKSQKQSSGNNVLIDAAAINNKTDVVLDLDWAFSTAGNRVFYVDLQGSNDLSQWHRVLNNQKLLEINTGGQVVYENRLKLPNRPHQFYQLRFRGTEVPAIKAVTARVVQQHLDRPLQWSTVDDFDVVEPDQQGHVLEWDLNAQYPIESLKLGFDYNNLMAQIRLYSKPHPQSAWRLVAQDEVYDVGDGELSMFNDQLHFASNNHRYWRLSSNSEINSQWVNDIGFAWRAHQIQFLAQGEGPYTLYFGDSSINQWPSTKWYQTLNEILRQDLFSKAIQLGQMKQIAVPAEVSEPKDETNNHSKWIFWGLLAVVLMMLGIMAVRLLREVAQE